MYVWGYYWSIVKQIMVSEIDSCLVNKHIKNEDSDVKIKSLVDYKIQKCNRYFHNS